VAKFTSATTIGNSNITDTGSLITLGSNTTISSGSLGIGTTSLTGYNLRVNKTLTGNTQAFSIRNENTIQSDVTSQANGYSSLLGTQAVSFTLNEMNHYVASQSTLGAGSTVTNQYGFFAGASLIGATNNFGFRGLIPSGTNRWNLYMDGTANNYLAGSLAIGGLTINGFSLNVQKSITGAVDSVGINQQGLVLSDVTNTASGFYNILTTQAATFNIGTYVHYRTAQGGIGAGSTITNQVGFQVSGGLTGATNNYGFRGQIASGTNRWNLYMDGTAANYLAGVLNIGTTTLAGFSLDVNGVTRITGTTATDSPPLGSELLTSANWTSTGWTGDFTTGFTHTTGNTSVLSNTLAAVIGTYYKIQITRSGGTAGSITIGFGGQTRAISVTRSFEPLATTTGNLTITPTSDFDGTILISVKTIGLASPSLTISPSTGTGQITMRATNVGGNTIIGLEAGQRLSSSGTGDDGANNTFIGYRAGRNSTQVRYNTFIGHAAGELTSTGTDNTSLGYRALSANTVGLENAAIGKQAGENSTGNSNTFFGTYAGQNLLTGNQNVMIGANAGRNITGGSTANTISGNSIFIGQNTRAAADNQSNQIVIGTGTTGLGNNTTIIGTTGTTLTALYGSLTLGTTTATASALLSMSSTTKGFLPPVMTSAERVAISSPATGLIVYQTDGVEGLWVKTSTVWREFTFI
jgi:hypothetical protein